MKLSEQQRQFLWFTLKRGREVLRTSKRFDDMDFVVKLLVNILKNDLYCKENQYTLNEVKEVMKRWFNPNFGFGNAMFEYGYPYFIENTWNESKFHQRRFYYDDEGTEITVWE